MHLYDGYVDTTACSLSIPVAWDFSMHLEPLANQESAVKPELGVNEVSEVAELENPVEVGIEQLQDLEPILDQIEPINPEIKPIEPRIEAAEILPENIDEEPLEEGEAY